MGRDGAGVTGQVDQRLAQLRTVLARLERLAESPRRDWALAEVRARIVDLETGHEPRPMRPLVEEPEPPPREPQPRASNGRVTRPAAPPPPPPPARLHYQPPEPIPADAALGGDEVLSLEEAPPDTSDAEPWKRGLRG
jgi:hypothetical protein